MNSLQGEYCVIKFSSGETIFSLVESEDEDCYVVEYPIYVDSETNNAWEFSTFTDENVFVFSKKHIIYIKVLNNLYANKYKEVVEEIVKKRKEETEDSNPRIEFDFPDTIQ